MAEPCLEIQKDVRKSYELTASKSKIKASAEYLEKNYQRPNLSIAEVASKFFMSEVHFRKLFKQEYGISPRKYLIRLRMQNAALMISVGLYTLQEVASMSGYTDYKYFCSEFKNYIGVSPSKYTYNFYDLYHIKSNRTVSRK